MATMSEEHEQTPFDAERAEGMVVELQDILRMHAALAGRTTNPVLWKLIHLCRLWWLRWYAVGLFDVADVDDTSDLAMNGLEAVGDVEEAIIRRFGRVAYDKFTQWAKAQDVGFEEPIYLRDHCLWHDPPPPPLTLVE
jgi:hypothetical protein